MAADGLITIPSAFGPEETMNRLKAEVRAKGMTYSPMSTTRLGPRRRECRCGQPTSSFLAPPTAACRLWSWPRRSGSIFR